MGSDYEESGSDEDMSRLEEEHEEEGEFEEEEDEEEEEQEEEFSDQEGIQHRPRRKKKQQELPKNLFNPVRYLANVLKAIEENGKVPERKKVDVPNIDVAAVKK